MLLLIIILSDSAKTLFCVYVLGDGFDRDSNLRWGYFKPWTRKKDAKNHTEKKVWVSTEKGKMVSAVFFFQILQIFNFLP